MPTFKCHVTIEAEVLVEADVYGYDPGSRWEPPVEAYVDITRVVHSNSDTDITKMLDGADLSMLTDMIQSKLADEPDEPDPDDDRDRRMEN